MKLSKFLFVFAVITMLPSCSVFSNETAIKEAYSNGYHAGAANETKRRYWADQNAVLPGLAVEEPEFKQITVPEHTTQDGVIIEEHNVVTTNPVTP